MAFQHLFCTNSTSAFDLISFRALQKKMALRFVSCFLVHMLIIGEVQIEIYLLWQTTLCMLHLLIFCLQWIFSLFKLVCWKQQIFFFFEIIHVGNILIEERQSRQHTKKWTPDSLSQLSASKAWGIVVGPVVKAWCCSQSHQMYLPPQCAAFDSPVSTVCHMQLSCQGIIFGIGSKLFVSVAHRSYTVPGYAETVFCSADVGDGGHGFHFQKCALPTMLWNSQRPVCVPSLLLNLGHCAVKEHKMCKPEAE